MLPADGHSSYSRLTSQALVLEARMGGWAVRWVVEAGVWVRVMLLVVVWFLNPGVVLVGV